MPVPSAQGTVVLKREWPGHMPGHHLKKRSLGVELLLHVL
jgi:hypothetical protein